MTPQEKRQTSSITKESAVLTELKETIRKQAAEIELLKKKASSVSKPATAVGHGAHGGGADAIDDLATYLEKPSYQIAKHRIGWLSLFLCSLSLTAVIMNGFEHTLSRQIELAYFVPLLAGHGGNTGGQTVGTVLSALSSGAVQPSDAHRVIIKEAMSGLIVGCVLGGCLGPVVHYGMGISEHVATVLCFTLPLVSTIAATLGSAIPFAAVALGLDPSVIAAPAMTSFVDVTGLMSYFLIANQIFRLFGLEL
jgi:Mg/Co/Ni transporter MgtE